MDRDAYTLIRPDKNLGDLLPKQENAEGHKVSGDRSSRSGHKVSGDRSDSLPPIYIYPKKIAPTASPPAALKRDLEQSILQVMEKREVSAARFLIRKYGSSAVRRVVSRIHRKVSVGYLIVALRREICSDIRSIPGKPRIDLTSRRIEKDSDFFARLGISFGSLR